MENLEGWEQLWRVSHGESFAVAGAIFAEDEGLWRALHELIGRAVTERMDLADYQAAAHRLFEQARSAKQ